MLKNYKKLMVIAPHPDEILGCGGLIAKFSKIKNTEISIVIVSDICHHFTNKRLYLKECLRSLETI